MNIPEIKTCYKMIHEMKMLDNIVEHSFKVSQLAVEIATLLMEKGVELNMDLIRTAALLHDITKTRSLETNENHSETGCEYLKEKYPEVAEIVRQHVILDKYNFTDFPTEAEVVNYSDKRVLHDEVKPLKERMAYIMERYGINEERKERISFYWEKTYRNEEKIFGILSIKPDECASMYKESNARDYFKYRNNLTATCLRR